MAANLERSSAADLDELARVWFAEVRAHYSPKPVAAAKTEPSGNIADDLVGWLLDAFNGSDESGSDGD